MENVISPFRRARDKILEIDVDGESVKVKPTVREMEMFVLMKKDMTESDAKRISQVLVNIVKNANPEEDEKDIEAWVGWHYMSFINTLAPIFGIKMQQAPEAETKKKSDILQE